MAKVARTPSSQATLAIVRARLSAGPPAALGSFGLLAAAGAAQGGYFPGSWGWLALACAWAAALAVALRDDAALSRAGVAMVLLLGGLAAWILLSSLWSADPTQTALEARRALVYVAALLAALLLARGGPSTFVPGIWAAIVVLAGYGLLTRLLPDRLGVTDVISGYRLSAPIGYWNALGLLAGMGALLGVGLAARDARLRVRAAAGASVVPLVCTLYFTFSRGAWVALFGGLLVLFAVDPRRLQLLGAALAVAPFAVLGVAAAVRSPALTTAGSAFPDMVEEGHRLGLVLVVLTAVAAAATLFAAGGQRFVAVPEHVRRVAGAGVLAVLVVAAVLGFVRYGSPLTLAQRGWDEFASEPVATGPNLTRRLFQLSGTGRVGQWHVAWDQARDNPWLGSGAGTYERFWYLGRTTPSKVRDVHSLYLEVLAELGPLGLGLLVGFLAVPLVAATRVRRSPLVPAALGAYAAYLIHVSAEWDWEITSVTLAALLCGVAILAADGNPRPVQARRLLAAICVGLAALALYGIVERTAMSRVEAAVARGDIEAAETEAGRAAGLAPWSTEPWKILARGQLVARRFAEARTTLRRALAKDDGDWLLWLELAKASDGRQRADALDEAERLNPHSPQVDAYRATLVSLSRL